MGLSASPLSAATAAPSAVAAVAAVAAAAAADHMPQTSLLPMDGC